MNMDIFVWLAAARANLPQYSYSMVYCRKKFTRHNSTLLLSIIKMTSYDIFSTSNIYQRVPNFQCLEFLVEIFSRVTKHEATSGNISTQKFETSKPNLWWTKWTSSDFYRLKTLKLIQKGGWGSMFLLLQLNSRKVEISSVLWIWIHIHSNIPCRQLIAVRPSFHHFVSWVNKWCE